MTTNVSPENERFIQQAIADGRFASRDEAINQAVQLLRGERNDNGHDIVVHSKSTEEWIADLRNWAASHRPVTHSVDFDRGAIYSGRGE